MKTLQFSLLCFTFFIMRSSSEAQSSFRNLGFESATLIPIAGDPYNRVRFDAAFPGWVGYVGNRQETAVLSNSIFLCCSAITVVDQFNPLQRIEGNYSAMLDASHDPYGDPRNPQPADTAIVQKGMIPTGMQSLLFKGQIYGTGGTVTIAGEPLSLVPISTAPNYVLFGADISRWAGQEAELKFTAEAGDGSWASGTIWILDSIEFSTTPVPEPSTFALLDVAGVFVWLIWGRKVRIAGPRTTDNRRGVPGSPSLKAL